MGVRLYNPTLGRFFQVDPIKGGSANDYDYAGADPINNFDLDGRCWSWCPHIRWRRTSHAIGTGLAVASSAASWIPGPVGSLGTAATGIWSSNFYKLGGDTDAGNRMLWATGVDAGLALVGGREAKLGYRATHKAISYLAKNVFGTGVGTILCGRPWTGCSGGFGHSGRVARHMRRPGDDS